MSGNARFEDRTDAGQALAAMLHGRTKPTTDDVVFETQALCRQFGDAGTRVDALRDVGLSILQGEFIVLLGPSGSGKSTLLNILGGLDVPTSGSVRYRGLELSQADEATLTRYRREHVGFVFQFYNLISSLTARENVQLATELVASPMDATSALAMVGLDGRQDHFPSQLSGGEQQRVAIARAIAKRPDCLLCDEPTGALDVQTGRQVLEALARVNRELGTTTVVITHNASIGRMADRVVRLRDGRIEGIDANARKVGASELDW
ncbi:MAG: Lipoprotein-releasing system ATP-binding protein LolD [Pseudomonadota bacterium]